MNFAGIFITHDVTDRLLTSADYLEEMANVATGSKDAEMKDVEDDKAKDEEPDPKQVQKDKDLLTFEGKNRHIPHNVHHSEYPFS